MIPFYGEEAVLNIYQGKNKHKICLDPKDMIPNKYIINPSNTKLIHLANFMLLLTILYIFLLPLFVSF